MIRYVVQPGVTHASSHWSPICPASDHHYVQPAVTNTSSQGSPMRPAIGHPYAQPVITITSSQRSPIHPAKGSPIHPASDAPDMAAERNPKSQPVKIGEMKEKEKSEVIIHLRVNGKEVPCTRGFDGSCQISVHVGLLFFDGLGAMLTGLGLC
ncbi:hypothetical protein Btru_018297 [Bulinus truncatus]|nr:hypothetical protein Btru_018297 [Bulinus truncatus]